MNIIVPPEESHSQPSWGLFCFDGSYTATGLPGSWAEYAHLAQVDGATFYQTYDVFDALMLDTQRTILTLRSPLITHFFSISRFRQLLSTSTGAEKVEKGSEGEDTEKKEEEESEGPEWLYSVFGYLLPEYVVGVEVHPSFVEHFVKPRSITFTFFS